MQIEIISSAGFKPPHRELHSHALNAFWLRANAMDSEELQLVVLPADSLSPN